MLRKTQFPASHACPPRPLQHGPACEKLPNSGGITPMTVEQIERPDMLSSHWRHMQKAFSELLVMAAQNSTGRPSPLQIKQRLASNPPPPSESTTAHAATAVAAPVFPEKNKIACECLLFLILIFFTHQSSHNQFRRAIILINRGVLLLQMS